MSEIAARGAAVHDRRAGRDDRHRRAAVPVGADQVLLQPGVLGEDVDAGDRDASIRSRSARRVTRVGAVRNTARRQMLVGALSIALWFTVAAAAAGSAFL